MNGRHPGGPPDSSISVINTTNNTVVATVPVGGSPIGVSVTPDGTKVYAANVDINNFSVINTTINTVTSTVPVGQGPPSNGNFIGDPVLQVADFSASPTEGNGQR